MKEKEVAAFVKRVAETLQLVHARGIVHCDLKLENVFVSTPSCEDEDDNWEDVGSREKAAALASVAMRDVVIGDFGEATDDKEEMASCSGTDDYMSPEVFAIRSRGSIKYTPAVDVWGLGIMAYELLGAKLKPAAVRVKGEFQWPDGVSEDAKSLVSSMLTRDPNERCGLEAVINHPWIVQQTTSTEQNQIIRRSCGVKRILPGWTYEEMPVRKKLAV